MNRAQLCAEASRIITTDRNTTHGEPEDSFGLIAAYWSSHLDVPVSAPDVAVMLLLKIARIRSNPEHLDSWVDAAGYAACGGEIATEADA